MTRVIEISAHKRGLPKPSLKAHQVVAQLCEAHLDDVMHRALEKALADLSEDDLNRILETY